MLRKSKTLVIVHHKGMAPSLQGFWDGRTHSGHYILEAPKLLTDRGQTRTLEGTVYIPRDQVAFIQTVAEDARDV